MGDTAGISDIYAASANITMTGNLHISASFKWMGQNTLQDTQYTWDPAGNMQTRADMVGNETESFTYDSLDRLSSVNGPYQESYFYDTLGNITYHNTTQYSYTDSAHKHAVTDVGDTHYTYDANGNMDYVNDTVSGTDKVYTWDAENRLTSVSVNGTQIARYVYDGDGNRVEKTENGETVIYVNQYYEKNITTGNVTTSYYLGGKLIAQSENGVLRYVSQDSLSSTSLMTDASGNQIGDVVKYLPFGQARAVITIPTDKLFTGQRLDGTGLYYYNARYYDPTLGRFISPDPITHSSPLPTGQVIKGLTVYRTLGLYAQQVRDIRFINPQEHNRYSYATNNPLYYYDPDGHQAVAAMVIGAGMLMIPGVGWVIGGVFIAIGAGWAVAEVVANTNFNVEPVNPVSDTVTATTTSGMAVSELLLLIQNNKNNSKKQNQSNNSGNTDNPDPNNKQGLGQAPKQGNPNSTYEQIDNSGNIRSRTYYDSQGRNFMRIDADSGHGIVGSHQHILIFNDKGQVIQEIINGVAFTP